MYLHNAHRLPAPGCNVTSAGDVERFVYCAHNWQLAQAGVNPSGPNERRGMDQHDAAGDALAGVQADDAFSNEGIQVSIGITALVASLMLFAVVIANFHSTIVGIILMAVASAVLLAAVGLFTYSLRKSNRAMAARKRLGISKGIVVDIDGKRRGLMLEDKDRNLRGRPDSILQTERGMVPVEIKTGRTPDRPHDSHRLQVATYLQLLEANTGTPPHHGLLTYPEGTFVVAWNDALRTELDAVLGRLRAAQTSGHAIRDHEEPGRCRGCSRRAGCTQALA